jgi:hypothetical protein
MCASLPDPQGYDDGDDDNDNDDAFINLHTSAFDVFTGDEGEELSEVGMVCSAPTNDNWFQPYCTRHLPRFHCSLPLSSPPSVILHRPHPLISRESSTTCTNNSVILNNKLSYTVHASDKLVVL